MVDRLLVTIPEAGEILGRKKTVAYEMAARGELETVILGSRRMVPVASLEPLVERLRTQTMTGVDRARTLADLVDDEGRIDVAAIPSGTTLADLEATKALVAARRGPTS